MKSNDAKTKVLIELSKYEESKKFVEDLYDELDSDVQAEVLIRISTNENCREFVESNIFKLSIGEIKEVYKEIEEKENYKDFIEGNKELFETIVNNKEDEALIKLSEDERWREFVEDLYDELDSDDKAEVLIGISKNEESKC